MTPPGAARLALAALAVAGAGARAETAAAPDAEADGGPRLEVAADGVVAVAAPLAPDGRWCLAWNHSVSGAEVIDCFRAEAGVMILEKSRQPDYAAGLGDIPGRGRVRADGKGGYWIEGIEAPLPEGLPLRVGSAAVGHRLVVGGETRPLPSALAGRRVVVRLGGG